MNHFRRLLFYTFLCSLFVGCTEKMNPGNGAENSILLETIEIAESESFPWSTIEFYGWEYDEFDNFLYNIRLSSSTRSCEYMIPEACLLYPDPDDESKRISLMSKGNPTVRVEDINFDGYADLMLQYGVGTNRSYHCLLYDPATKQFKNDSDCSQKLSGTNISFFPKKRKIICRWHISSDESIEVEYIWRKGILVEIDKYIVIKKL